MVAVNLTRILVTPYKVALLIYLVPELNFFLKIWLIEWQTSFRWIDLSGMCWGHSCCAEPQIIS